MKAYVYNQWLKKAVNLLILVNLACFISFSLIGGPGWFYRFGLVPKVFFGRVSVWRLFTYMFIHAGFWHLLVNMLMLWFFGPGLESRWGRKKFFIYYFFTGVGAGLCSALFAPGSLVPVVGASGAVFGILVAFTLLYPDTEVLLFFILPVKMRQAILLFIGINLVGAVLSPLGGIAYIAHLGGGLFGFLYMKSQRLQSWLEFSWHREKVQDKKAQRQKKKQQDLDSVVDTILDKIAKRGLGSLTDREKQILNKKAQGQR